jgi:hypothetical protein
MAKRRRECLTRSVILPPRATRNSPSGGADDLTDESPDIDVTYRGRERRQWAALVLSGSRTKYQRQVRSNESALHHCRPGKARPRQGRSGSAQ